MKTSRTLTPLSCLLVAAFQLISCAGAAPQPQGPPPGDRAVEQTSDKTFMWEAVHPDMPGKTLHLLGSIHAGSEDFYPLDPAIEEAFEGSDVLVMELDESQMSPEIMMGLTVTYGLLPEGETIEAQLSPETFAALEAAGADLGLPMDKMSTMRPWMVALNLSVIQVIVAGLDPTLGIDNYFMKKAKAASVEVIGLETARQQILALAEMEPRVQERYLVSVLEDMGEVREGLAKMVAAWMAGDAEGLDELLREGEGEDPLLDQMYDRLFTMRNTGMAEGIVKAMGEHDHVFVVVGSGHLVGEGSVVDLLEREGFEVTQVSRGRP